MWTIERLTAREILDSRGRPTVAATCALVGGAVASASVPSGASTGRAEAVELRDGDPSRYGGLGTRKAVANVNGPIATALVGRPWAEQAALDGALVDLDGTPNKSRLGANAILAVSLAFARACAIEQGIPLYRYFARLLGEDRQTLPRMTINLFSGGKHAGGQVAIQDVLLVPVSATTLDQGLADVYAVYQSAARLTTEKYKSRPLRADEGGLAPPFTDARTMLADAVQAIRAAGFEPGRQMTLAVDVASSHFYEDGRYNLDGDSLDSDGMIRRVADWIEEFPIVSVEDGLAEDDWTYWPKLRRAVGTNAIVVGDDFLCTNAARIRRAIETRSAGALLLKVNQIGVLTEAADAARLARSAGWCVTVSARSGETEDTWLADLAVAWGDQIKVGSITQSERLAKYNRLLEIEAETGWALSSWPASTAA